ncbi:MAG: transposase [Aliarcobacter sp.]|nr:transposase [Aliarcobacter sp.]
MLNEWKIRLLEAVYPFVFLDAIHYKVKEDGKCLNIINFIFSFIKYSINSNGNKYNK